MDSVDLIARENEFKKLNKQLEKKTESLMKEIEEVMQKPDIFSTPNLNLNLYNNTTRKHSCSPKSSPISDSCAPRTTKLCTNVKPKEIRTRNTEKICAQTELSLKKECNLDSVKKDLHNDNCATSNSCAKRSECDCCKVEVSDNMEFLYAFVSFNVKDNVLPQSFLKAKITVQSVCKCLSNKIKLMQEQIDKLQSTIDKKNKQCEAHLTHIAELESERLSLLNTANTMKSDTAEMKAKYLAIQNRLNDKDRPYKEQRGMTDKLTVELKQYKTKNCSLEARCASQEEVIANLKQEIEVAKLSEKEYRTSTRSLSASHESTINQLKSQITALNSRAAKQQELVANLRQQRALLSAGRALRTHTEEYCKLLEGE
ncbi:uncharacterized protein [Epargyreus clarus]|uniref:uncharacterized protein n=1 Tax=Epargyreus clarus TaxID=520877 RepID=UPI003C2E89BE